MSLEEKMFLRFQKERSKKARNSSLYNLGDDNEELLTHKGQILGESNVMDNDFESSDEEDGNGKLNKEVVNSLHFGGGFVAKDSEQGHVGKKGRLEALQEIVMKSKMYKAQRKEAKEEQETARARIDAAFDELIRTDLVDMDEKRFKKSYTANEVDDYDKMMVDMANEAKAQPAERTKTAEELAMEEREKMEELEKARLKRMRETAQGQNNQSNGRNQGGEQGGKKPRVRNDDELDDVYFDQLNQDRYGDRTLTRTEDPLEEDENDEEGEDDDDEEDDEDDDDDDEEEEEDEDGDDDDEFVEDEDVEDFEQEDSDNDDSAAKESGLPANFEHIPHTVVCPSDSAAFDNLLKRHCRYFPYDHIEIVNRIVSWNNVHLPGEKGQENRKLMHNFLDILMKYLVRMGGKLSTASAAQTAGYKLLVSNRIFEGILFVVRCSIIFICSTVESFESHYFHHFARFVRFVGVIVVSYDQNYLPAVSKANKRFCTGYGNDLLALHW